MSTLLLFDVDGTLTPPRKIIEADMVEILKKLVHNPKIHIGFVGGSDLAKQKEQLHEVNFPLFTWRFSENGLEAYHIEECIHKGSFVELLGEANMKTLINVCLEVLATTDAPRKRGGFIEFRNGMLNISPVGRSCSQEDREEFNAYDQIHHVRTSMIAAIQHSWSEYIFWSNIKGIPNLKFSIGGQISVDIFPEGWDKTYCLQFVEKQYDEIHFFGDKTSPGGNDYEIFNDSRVVGHTVSCYQDTIKELGKFL